MEGALAQCIAREDQSARRGVVDRDRKITVESLEQVVAKMAPAQKERFGKRHARSPGRVGSEQSFQPAAIDRRVDPYLPSVAVLEP